MTNNSENKQPTLYNLLKQAWTEWRRGSREQVADIAYLRSIGKDKAGDALSDALVIYKQNRSPEGLDNAWAYDVGKPVADIEASPEYLEAHKDNPEWPALANDAARLEEKYALNNLIRTNETDYVERGYEFPDEKEYIETAAYVLDDPLVGRPSLSSEEQNAIEDETKPSTTWKYE